MDEWMTVPEAADRLGVSTQTIRRLIRREELTYRRVTERRTEVLRKEIEARLSPPRKPRKGARS